MSPKTAQRPLPELYLFKPSPSAALAINKSANWNPGEISGLAIGGPLGGSLKIVYVGETINESKRVIAYASHGSHLADIIRRHLNQGWHLFYRAQMKTSKQKAVCMQNNLLRKFDYPWNIMRNGK